MYQGSVLFNWLKRKPRLITIRETLLGDIPLVDIFDANDFWAVDFT